jgi:hypothetical protein
MGSCFDDDGKQTTSTLAHFSSKSTGCSGTAGSTAWLVKGKENGRRGRRETNGRPAYGRSDASLFSRRGRRAFLRSKSSRCRCSSAAPLPLTLYTRLPPVVVPLPPPLRPVDQLSFSLSSLGLKLSKGQPPFRLHSPPQLSLLKYTFPFTSLRAGHA